MRNLLAIVPLLLLPTVAAVVVVPFDNADLGLSRRSHNTCPRIVYPYYSCDDTSKCCTPGHGCNTSGKGNVGQVCVKRVKDDCKSDSDCGAPQSGQTCVNNGKEPSFCAYLDVAHPPKPTHKKPKKGGKKAKPSSKLHPSSLAPSSLAPSSMIMAPSSMIMAPSSMIMAPSSMIMAPSSMVMAPPTGKPKAALPKPKTTGKSKPTKYSSPTKGKAVAAKPKATKPPTPSKGKPATPASKPTSHK